MFKAYVKQISNSQRSTGTCSVETWLRDVWKAPIKQVEGQHATLTSKQLDTQLAAACSLKSSQQRPHFWGQKSGTTKHSDGMQPLFLPSKHHVGNMLAKQLVVYKTETIATPANFAGLARRVLWWHRLLPKHAPTRTKALDA